MRIVPYYRPSIGGPTDGRGIRSPWSRVWVWVNRQGLPRDGEVCDQPEIADDWQSPLTEATRLLCPDTDLAMLAVEMMGNMGWDLGVFVREIEGVYVLDPERDVWRWVQLRQYIAPAMGSNARRHVQLARFIVREYALHERIEPHISAVVDRTSYEVEARFPLDADLQLRTRAYRLARSRMAEDPSAWLASPPPEQLPGSP